MFKGSRKRGRVGRECWRLYSTTTPPSAKMKDGCGLKFLPIPVSQKYSYYTNQRMDHSCLLVILLLPVTQAWPGNLSPQITVTFSCAQSEEFQLLSPLPLERRSRSRDWQAPVLSPNKRGPCSCCAHSGQKALSSWGTLEGSFHPLPGSGFDFLEGRCAYSRVPPWFGWKTKTKNKTKTTQSLKQSFLFWSSFALSQILFSDLSGTKSLSLCSDRTGLSFVDAK